MKTEEEKRRFILANTEISAPPHISEIKLHLACEAHELWLKTEEELKAIGLPPPFWAFAWAGGQGLARYLLDHPESVIGKTVLDLATGSGLVAIAAMLAGASNVTANDIDPYCRAAVALNSKINGVRLNYDGSNFLTLPLERFDRFDVILAGDVFYDRPMAGVFFTLLQQMVAAEKRVLVGDPGRAYLPKSGLAMLAEYQVPVSRILEDSEVKRTRVWQVKS